MEIVIDRNVMVPMRDGVHLATDIYRPVRGEPVPALIHRLPYGKHVRSNVDSLLLNPIEAVERGYAVVVQDTRGSGASEGVFDPIFQERADGHDCIDWGSKASWCNGEVGIYGSSYMGVTTLQATVDAPSALKASLAYLTGANYHETWAYVGGAFELGFQLRWSLADASMQIQRSSYEDSAARSQIEEALIDFATDPDGYYASSMDPRSLPRACNQLIPYYAENLDHPNYDDYWNEIDVLAAVDRIRVPVMGIAGWHDAFLKSGVDLYRALIERGPEATQNSHVLVVGPWDHRAYLSASTVSAAGSRNFGPLAAGGQVGLQSMALDWFDRWLKHGEQSFPQVRYFHMGPNQWKETTTWPPLPLLQEKWYLHSGGNAATRRGDGVLSKDVPGDQLPDSYVYDPENPAPTVGGRHLTYHLPSGVQDQGLTEDRQDVLVYSSSVLVQPLTIIGEVRLDLFFCSSAPTADFYAVLVDVNPDGKAENVADGIIRLLLEDSITEGSIRFTSIDLWETAFTFPVGHRIRVHLTSSCFPRFDRNRNVGPSKENRELSPTAIQRILHNFDHPSALIFQIRESELG
jgi:hypothetical protein